MVAARRLPSLWVFGLCLGLLVAGAAPVATAADLGEYFKVCSRSDPKLNECVVESLNGAREHLVKGVPSLALAPIDPMRFSVLRVEEGPADFQLRLVLRDVRMRGLARFVATRARVDLPGRYLEVDIQVPELLVDGRYSFGGRIITLPIQGEGPFNATIGGVNVTNRIHFEEERRGDAGVLHWKVDEYIWDMSMDALRNNFRNLFGGNKRLGQYANFYINRHWKPMYQIYKHIVISNFGYQFQNLTNPMLAKVPFDQLFKP